jgi:putative Mn2+ efflux pump MntP
MFFFSGLSVHIFSYLFLWLGLVFGDALRKYISSGFLNIFAGFLFIFLGVTSLLSLINLEDIPFYSDAHYQENIPSLVSNITNIS